MARIEWAMWANEQAVISSCILILGSILALCSIMLEFPHVRWGIGAYSLVVSLLILLLEYPRGKRAKGNSRPRIGQDCAKHFVSYLGPLGRNYFIRFVFYLILCIPCLLQLATVMGGLSLIITAFIYLKASLSGEKWMPCESNITQMKSLVRPVPPSVAPPRYIRKTNEKEGISGDLTFPKAGESV